MHRVDLEFLVQLAHSLGWTTTRSDIESLFSYEPAGCFVADLKGEVVGSVTTTPYTHFGWIGMVLVKEELRRRGIGSALMQRACRYLQDKAILTVRLEQIRQGFPCTNIFALSESAVQNGGIGRAHRRQRSEA
jgi:GNAT superfamily N-acetyltransferase